ncbi:MAG: hypothetical protein IJ007_09345 [Oscillospiraceae bacterium]|nr:hypothetical protein [Oscillospiraceae bacterium]
MVIHTIINEYDLLYAQQREAAYAEEKPSREVHTDTAAYKNLTQLPDIRKGIFSNDNS